MSRAARRAGTTAATTPATIATNAKITSVSTGTWKPTPWLESPCVTSAARNSPSGSPRPAPISAVITLSCRIIRRTCRRVIPIARSIPSSRVRSNTESTSVFTIPNRLTITDSASRTYRNWSSWSTPCARFETQASRVRIFTSGKLDRAPFSADVVESVAPPRTFTNVKRSFGRGKPLSKALREIMIPPKSGSI